MTALTAPAFERAAPSLTVTLSEIAAYALGVGILLIYSQGWLAPLFGDGVAEAGLVRALFLPAYAAAVGLIAMAPGATVKASLRQPFLLLLVGLACASTLWSIAPDETLRRAFAVVFTTLGGVALAARFRWAQLAEVIGATFLILAALTVVVCIAVPRIGVMHELFPGAWKGLWQEKNALGGVMALGALLLSAAAVLNPRRRWLWAGAAVVCVGLVGMSTSKTSLVALALGFAAFGFVFVVRRGPAMGVAASWGAVCGLALAAVFLLFASDVFLGLLGKDATLTGRTKIWSAVLTQIQERPWTGFGYFAVWRDAGGWGPLAWIVKDAGFKPEHAHNAWLEQWLGMGVAGLALWGLFYLQTLATGVIAVFRGPGGWLAFPFLIVFSLMSLTESVAMTYNDFRWTLFVALATKLAFPDVERRRAVRVSPRVLQVGPLH